MISRYDFTKRKGVSGASAASYKIRRAVEEGRISYTTEILQEGIRLDQVAGSYYGDSSLWWIIAAASNIGWSLQLPAGTIVNIPTNISDVISILA